MSKTCRTFANAFGSKKPAAKGAPPHENIERFTIETRVVQEQETAPFGAAEKLKSIL